MIISQKAFDLIVDEETGGRAEYERTEIHPTWPGGMSGVTIGIGYDCGYESAVSIGADWIGKLTPFQVADLQHCAGIHGSPARALAHELRSSVSVGWDLALDVFKQRDVPKWEGIVTKALLNTDKLSPDSFGALVSLCFNRGASFTLPGNRYIEMRSIKGFMEAQRFDLIPDQMRAMKRLWPDMAGLRHRRDHEADLFEEGLKGVLVA